ncbi:MAG: hypothetical protein P8Z49_07360 [Acidobacteriota bacterium]
MCINVPTAFAALAGACCNKRWGASKISALTSGRIRTIIFKCRVPRIPSFVPANNIIGERYPANTLRQSTSAIARSLALMTPESSESSTSFTAVFKCPGALP